MAQSLTSGSGWIAFDIAFSWDKYEGWYCCFESFCLTKYGIKLHPPWDDKGEIFFTVLYYDSTLTLLLKALLSPLDLIVFTSERFLIFGLSSIIFLQFVRGESF